MQDLKLQARASESRNRAQQSRTPALAEEKPKKQVTFNIDKELGGEPTLPTGMTLFLSGGEPLNDILLSPLLQQGLFVHCGLTTKKTPNEVPPPLDEPGLKSQPGHPLPDPHWGQMDQIQWVTPRGGSMPRCWGFSMSPGGRPQLPMAGWWCSPTSYMRASTNLNPFGWLIGRQWHSIYPRPSRKQQDSGPLHSQSLGFTSETTCLYLHPPISG